MKRDYRRFTQSALVMSKQIGCHGSKTYTHAYKQHRRENVKTSFKNTYYFTLWCYSSHDIVICVYIYCLLSTTKKTKAKLTLS